jgi:peptide/nickel transport system permease protein
MGTPTWRLIFVHALRFASVQIVAMIGLNFVLTFGGTVMIEQLFVLPGLGVNAQGAIGTHDIPAIQVTVVITTLVVVVTNLVTELLVMFLNPKIRTR